MDGQRIFTVEEANQLIPQLESAFDELEDERRELDQGIDRIKILDVLWGPRLREPANPDRQEFLTHRASVRQNLREIEAVVEQRILSLGVRFPAGGLAHGLVDFPTTLDGRVVFLCWKRGEPRLQAWHEVDGGFAGRRPLTLEIASRMGT